MKQCLSEPAQRPRWERMGSRMGACTEEVEGRVKRGQGGESGAGVMRMLVFFSSLPVQEAKVSLQESIKYHAKVYATMKLAWKPEATLNEIKALVACEPHIQ